MLFPIESATDFPNFLNTPGIYYAIAYWFSAVLFLNILPAKLKGIRKWSILIGCGIFLSFFMTVTKNYLLIFFIPLMIADALILFFMFWSVTEMDIKHDFYYTIRAFIMGEFLASFEWQLYAFFVRGYFLKIGLVSTLIVSVPVYALFFIGAYFLEKRYRETEKPLNLQWTAVNGALIIVVFVYTLSNLSFVFRNTPFSARFTNEILLLRTVVDLAGMIILYMYHVLLHQMSAEIEVKTLKSMLDAQYANYKISRDSIDMINQKYHDLKHQIAILRAESGEGASIDSGEKMKYLDKMERDIKQYEAQNKTGNKVLDIILTTKSLSCQHHHIDLTVVADGKAINFMDTMDISALFGNALDNAIESVRKIENYSQRLIHLTVVRRKAFVQIKVENTYEGEISFRNGLPLTTKSDKNYHGFGIKSMRQTAEKYGGSLTVDTKGNWFRLNILLPYKEKSE